MLVWLAVEVLYRADGMPKVVWYRADTPSGGGGGEEGPLPPLSVQLPFHRCLIWGPSGASLTMYFLD